MIKAGSMGRGNHIEGMIAKATIREWVYSKPSVAPEEQREFYDFLLDGRNQKEKDRALREVFERITARATKNIRNE